MVLGRVVRIAGLLIGTAALVLALAPFRTGITLHDLSGAYPTFARSCGPPVVEATRDPPQQSGWFGYAPLAATPVDAPRACHNAATGRLALSVIGLFLASLLGLWTARIDGGPGWYRREQWRPHPA